MNLRNALRLLCRHMGYSATTLKTAFNILARKKQGLFYGHVRIVDNKSLQEAIAQNPYNENINRTAGRDKAFPEFLQIIPSGATYFIICDHQHRIIAGATLRRERDRATEMRISQISVHKDFRNQGYATRLLQAIKDHMNITHPDVTRLSISKFKPLGWKYLRPKFIALATEFKADTFEIDVSQSEQ